MIIKSILYLKNLKKIYKIKNDFIFLNKIIKFFINKYNL